MKRAFLILGGLLALFMPRDAAALSCVIPGSCTDAAPCAFSDTTKWQSCGGGVPGSGDTVTNVGTLVLDTSSVSTADFTNYGHLIWDPSASSRDGDGLRTLNVFGGFFQQDGSSFDFGPGDRLQFDSTAGLRDLQISGNNHMVARGGVLVTTIKAITIAAAAGSPAGCAAGMQITITPATGFNSTPSASTNTTIRTKRRMEFRSGQMRNRQMEIAQVNAGGSFDVCTHFTDAAGGLQRLTKHASFVRTFPLAKHSISIPIPASQCTGAAAPDYGCTGAGTMNAVQEVPAVGDQIAIYNDGFIGATTANGVRIFSPAAGLDNLPTFQNVTFYNLASSSALACIDISAKTAAQTAPDFSGNNVHDTKCSTGGTVRYNGAQNMTFAHNVIHDDAGSSDSTSAALTASYSSTNSLAPNGITVSDSIFYRNRDGDVSIGTSGANQVTGAKIVRNTFLEGCTTTNGACVVASVNGMTGFEISHNKAYYYQKGNFKTSVSDQGSVAVFSTSADASLTQVGFIGFNWCVNVGGGCYAAGNDPIGVSIVGNYCSHITGTCGTGGDYFGNIFKNYSLFGNGDGHAILSPNRYIKGNYLYGIDPAYMNTADCVAAVGTGTGCTRHGVVFYDNVNTDLAREFTDNVCASLYDNELIATSGANQNGACFISPSGSLYPHENVTMTHITADDRGVNYNYATETAPLNPDYYFRNIWIADTCDGAVGACPVSHTYTIGDIVTMNNNGYDSITCAGTTTGITKAIGTVWAQKSAVQRSSSGGLVGADCASQTSGLTYVSDIGYIDAYGGNYNLRQGSAALTAGTAPAGSAVGVRAFRFNRDFLKPLWGAAVTFDGEMPADISNGTMTCPWDASRLCPINLDTDGDGVLDLFDNCDLTWNPNQYDGDNDGKGCACDASGDTCP